MRPYTRVHRLITNLVPGPRNSCHAHDRESALTHERESARARTHTHTHTYQHVWTAQILAHTCSLFVCTLACEYAGNHSTHTRQHTHTQTSSLFLAAGGAKQDLGGEPKTHIQRRLARLLLHPSHIQCRCHVSSTEHWGSHFGCCCCRRPCCSCCCYCCHCH